MKDLMIVLGAACLCSLLTMGITFGVGFLFYLFESLLSIFGLLLFFWVVVFGIGYVAFKSE